VSVDAFPPYSPRTDPVHAAEYSWEEMVAAPRSRLPISVTRLDASVVVRKIKEECMLC
jgi:hypothetical protein